MTLISLRAQMMLEGDKIVHSLTFRIPPAPATSSKFNIIKPWHHYCVLSNAGLQMAKTYARFFGIVKERHHVEYRRK